MEGFPAYIRTGSGHQGLPGISIRLSEVSRWFRRSKDKGMGIGEQELILSGWFAARG